MLIVVGVAGFVFVSFLWNPYRTSQEIRPTQEISASESSIDLGGATFAVPRGWEVEQLLRFDDGGRPLTAYVVRKLDGQRKAFMVIEVLDQQPTWRGNAEVRRAATKTHDHVTFDVTDREPPSGDDTPATYTLHAFAKKKEMFLYMYVTFFTPVVPRDEDAVYYIDAFQFPVVDSLQ